MPSHSPRRALAVLAVLAMSLGLACPAQAGEFDAENRAATAVQLALPALAGVCAARQGRGKSFAAGFAVETAVVQGLKYGLGRASINRRPNGGDRGFPSGHAALAMLGATDLARNCFPDKPVLGALAYGAALVVAASRVHTHNHNAGQALFGLAIGYFADGVTVSAGADGFSLGYSMDF